VREGREEKTARKYIFSYVSAKEKRRKGVRRYKQDSSSS
jgi:hypothetical protein